MIALASVSLCAPAQSQGFFDSCFDPTNTDPLSQDALATDIIALSGFDGMFSVLVGLNGSYDFGPTPPCAPDLVGQHDIAGAISFISIMGSFLSGQDDAAALTGAASLNTNQTPPLPLPAIVASNQMGFASVRVIDADGAATDSKWGADGFDSFTAPNSSNRYMTLIDTVEGDAEVTCRFRDYGSSIRMEWTITNRAAEPQQIGLCHAQWVRMLGDDFTVPVVSLPTQRPALIQQIWNRVDEPNFPAYVDFLYTQSSPYPAIRFRLSPDDQHEDQTAADTLAITVPEFFQNPWELGFLPDAFHKTAIAYYFNPVLLNPNQSRRIVMYVEPSSVFARPEPPYSLATEAEPVVKYDAFGQNELNPNPFIVYGFINNQYGVINQQVTMQNVAMTITLPDGLSLAPGEQATKFISTALPNEFGVVTWMVEADGLHAGFAEYSIEANPGFPTSAPTRTITGRTIVSLTPRVDLFSGPNLITLPWNFNDPSFAGMGLGGGTAYNWDANAQAYAVATNAVRGVGQWIVFDADPAPISLSGASMADLLTEFTQTLARGWNLIGNPHPYPVQLNQLIGFNAAIPGQAFTWEQMVDQNWIRSPLYWWDAQAGDYLFNANINQFIQPGVGYWVYINSVDPIDVAWPVIFLAGLPDGNLNSKITTPVVDGWTIPISVAGNRQKDRMNAFGMARTNADESSVAEPPIKPGGNLQLSFLRGTGNSSTQWAYDVKETSQSQTFKAQVRTIAPGSYTLNWKAPRSVPRNTVVIIRDLTTGAVRNMKINSSMTFTMAQAGTRRFDITVVNR